MCSSLVQLYVGVVSFHFPFTFAIVSDQLVRVFLLPEAYIDGTGHCCVTACPALVQFETKAVQPMDCPPPPSHYAAHKAQLQRVEGMINLRWMESTFSLFIIGPQVRDWHWGAPTSCRESTVLYSRCIHTLIHLTLGYKHMVECTVCLCVSMYVQLWQRSGGGGGGLCTFHFGVLAASSEVF